MQDIDLEDSIVLSDVFECNEDDSIEAMLYEVGKNRVYKDFTNTDRMQMWFGSGCHTRVDNSGGDCTEMPMVNYNQSYVETSREWMKLNSGKRAKHATNMLTILAANMLLLAIAEMKE